MKAICPSCNHAYEIKEAKIPDKGAYAICKKCKTRFFIQKTRSSSSQTSETMKEAYKKPMNECPKCGFNYEIEKKECPKCGVIFEKAVNESKKHEISSKSSQKSKIVVVSKSSSTIYFLRWTFGYIFLLSGLVALLMSSPLFGFVSLLISIILIPSIYHLIRPNPNFHISKVAGAFSLLVGIICILLGLGAFVSSNIFGGILCILFGILLFPDVFQILSKKETKFTQVFGALIVILIGGWMASQFMLADMKSAESEKKKTPTPQQRNWREMDDSVGAYMMIERYVKQRLSSPKSAEFPGFFDGRSDHVKKIGEQKYKIVSWVDAQNRFGALIRTHFIGEIEQVNENEWLLHSLKFIQR